MGVDAGPRGGGAGCVQCAIRVTFEAQAHFLTCCCLSRLTAAVLQLNVRKILADAGRADAINIICQKVRRPQGSCEGEGQGR